MRTLLVSPSTLDLSSCMTKYLYSKVVRAALETSPAYLEKGTMIHVMLAVYYREKMKNPDERLTHLEMIDKAISKGREKVVGMDLDIEESEDIVVNAFNQYCLFWQSDPYIPIAVEEPVAYVLFEDEELRVILQLIVDVIFENQQGHQIWTDHKTRSRNKTAIPLGNQFMAYAVVSGTRRSMRNNIGFQKTLAAEKKFTRDFFPYPQGVLDWWINWTVHRAEYIANCVRDDTFPPDFSICDMYSGCDFVEVCMQSPEHRERFLQDNFIKRGESMSIYEREK